MPPEKHALLSASASSRWLVCTAAPRFEETLPEKTSTYAEEGRLAHEIAELKIAKRFHNLHGRTFNSRMNKLKQSPLYDPEMDGTTDEYIEHLVDLFMSFDSPPTVAAEVSVDYGDYAPRGFGTCDCVMVGGDTLLIADYKHGKGVPVSAEGNSQMRLYALGALKRYEAIYADSIKRVIMCIMQPRLSSFTSDTISVEDLKNWGRSIKPIAQRAYIGLGEFVPGEHCRFCRGKAECKARAAVNTALEEFKDAAIPGSASDQTSKTLTDEQIGDLLTRGKDLMRWYEDLTEYATNALLNGRPIPGWKMVEGRSNRKFSDQDAAFEAAKDAGYDEALLYTRKPISLSEMEKLMGKKTFADTVGGFVIKPPGAPTLAPESDKRPPYNSAAADFSKVANNTNE